MNGFDIWTSEMAPEDVARLIAFTPCDLIKDICPLFDKCDIDGRQFKPIDDVAHKCYEKLCEYFDKEVEQ